MAKKKKSERQKAIEKLDKVFSIYIRKKFAVRGKCKCYTCGKVDRLENMQNGHFKSRRFYKYRRDENNCRPQCVGCNMFKQGNYIEYTTRMIDDMGRERVDTVKNDNSICKMSTAEIIELLETYTKKI